MALFLRHLAGYSACIFGVMLGLSFLFGGPLMIISEESWRGAKKVATNLFTIAVSLGMSKLCFMLFDWGTRHLN